MKKIACALLVVALLSFALISSMAADIWTCPACGQSDNTGNFCTNCGTAKPYWTCPACGQSDNTDNFCTNCGHKRTDPSGGAAQAPAVTPSPKPTPTAIPDDIVDYGKWSNNLIWTLDRSGTLRIHGKGKMENNRQWNGTNRPDIETVVIESGVTIITNSAFNSLNNVKRVSLPDTVRRIDSYAFSGTALESITIPNGVTDLREGAFYDCKNLKSVEILARIDRIEEGVFSHCEKLARISIPRTVKTIGQGAFQSSGLETIVIPGSVESIGKFAFQYCKALREVYLEDGLAEIGYGAFSECDSLTTIALPNSVTSIGKCAFSSRGLESISIPGSVEAIGEYAFPSTLKEFYFGGSREQWDRFGIEIGRYCKKVFDGVAFLPLPTVTPLPPHTDFHAYSD